VRPIFSPGDPQANRRDQRTALSELRKWPDGYHEMIILEAQSATVVLKRVTEPFLCSV
jgi:hypothetical protein